MAGPAGVRNRVTPAATAIQTTTSGQGGRAAKSLFASEAAAGICDKAARVLASYGYSMEYAVQRHLRDIRFTLIGGGTSEILKLVIAKELSA